MRLVSFDFQHIDDSTAFYRLFAQKFELHYFGANLDALWDMLTAGIALPVRVTLRHLHGHQDGERISRIVAVMQEAEQETGGAFSVRIC